MHFASKIAFCREVHISRWKLGRLQEHGLKIRLQYENDHIHWDVEVSDDWQDILARYQAFICIRRHLICGCTFREKWIELGRVNEMVRVRHEGCGRCRVVRVEDWDAIAKGQNGIYLNEVGRDDLEQANA